MGLRAEAWDPRADNAGEAWVRLCCWLRGAGARDLLSGVLPRGVAPRLLFAVVECVVGVWLRVCGRVPVGAGAECFT